MSWKIKILTEINNNYTLRRSLTEIQPCSPNVQGIPVC